MFPVSQKIRWLVDCDSFYASCEIYLNPKLRWLPVCIWWDIVIARSYQAKAYGIKVGTPIREAKKLLPKNAVFLPPRITHYWQISHTLMAYLHEKCNEVEVFSIDEAFFEISWYSEIYNLSYAEIARRMKHDIYKKIWIPVSIWIWPTKLLAKMFAEVNKPYWELVCLAKKDIDMTLQSLPLAHIPFIWPKTQEKLRYVCTTAYDYTSLSYAYIRDLLGKNWLNIWLELNCINAMTLGNKKKPKSIHRTRSFNPHFTSDKDILWSRLLDNIDKSCEHLLDVHMATTYIAISFRTKDFHRFSLDTKLPYPTNDKLFITKTAKTLFESMTIGSIVFRTTWMYLWNLVDMHHLQTSLFTPHTARKNNDALNTIIHTINKKYWRGTVRLWEAKQTQQKNTIFELEV